MLYEVITEIGLASLAARHRLGACVWKEVAVVPALAIILLFQLVGEVISRAAHLPLPGPVLGMIGMVVAISVSTWLRELIRP